MSVFDIEYTRGMVYAGAMQSYADVADPTKLIPGL